MPLILVTPYRKIAQAIADAFKSKVSMLLHAEDGDGVRSLTNSGYGTGAFTFVGGAKISTAQARFGKSSLYFGGGSDQVAIPAAASGTNLDSGDFTIEAWVFPTGQGNYAILSRWQNQ